MGGEKNPGRMTPVLGALVVLLLEGGPLLLVPLSVCPNCRGRGRANLDVAAWWYWQEHGPNALLPAAAADHLTVPCDRCSKRGRVSLLHRWTRPNPSPLMTGSVRDGCYHGTGDP